MNSSVLKSYAFIRQAILMGQYTPGSPLREVALADAIGVSRTPVREAIGLLEHEGLVVQVPNCGASVRTPDATEASQLYEIRELIETHAAARAARRISAADLEKLHRHLDGMRSVPRIVRDAGLTRLEGELDERWRSANLAFHYIILASSGNPSAIKMAVNAQALTRLFSLSRRYPPSRANLVRTLARVCLIHYRILKALDRHDPDAARQAMTVHMHYAQRDVHKRISPNHGD